MTINLRPDPCPFCGFKFPEDLSDNVYPSGTRWREDNGVRHYLSHRDPREGNRCYQVVCEESMSGCGAEIHGDSEQEAIEKWNRRV